MSSSSQSPRLLRPRLQLAPSGDARQEADRRSEPTRALSRHTLFGGRRRKPRRAEERVEPYFVDQWGPGLFAAVCAVVALNFLDAWFTIFMLSFGGMEMNPLIDYVLQLGFWPFILTKSFGIGLCVAVLAVTSRFRAARFGLGVVLVGYSVLLWWHLHLLGMLDL